MSILGPKHQDSLPKNIEHQMTEEQQCNLLNNFTYTESEKTLQKRYYSISKERKKENDQISRTRNNMLLKSQSLLQSDNLQLTMTSEKLKQEILDNQKKILMKENENQEEKNGGQDLLVQTKTLQNKINQLNLENDALKIQCQQLKVQYTMMQNQENEQQITLKNLEKQLQSNNEELRLQQTKQDELLIKEKHTNTQLLKQLQHFQTQHNQLIQDKDDLKDQYQELKAQYITLQNQENEQQITQKTLEKQLQLNITENNQLKLYQTKQDDLLVKEKQTNISLLEQLQHIQAQYNILNSSPYDKTKHNQQVECVTQFIVCEQEIRTIKSLAQQNFNLQTNATITPSRQEILNYNLESIKQILKSEMLQFKIYLLIVIVLVCSMMILNIFGMRCEGNYDDEV